MVQDKLNIGVTETDMSNSILKEMHQLSHEDDLRYLLLMRGVKQLLEERKRNRNHLIEELDI